MKEGLSLKNEAKRVIAGTLAAIAIGGSTPAMAEGLSESDKLSTSFITTTEGTNGLTTSDEALAKLLSTESTIQMDVAAQIINDRTLVPIRFVAENLGCTVDWKNNGNNQTVTVTNKDTTIIMTKDNGTAVFRNVVNVNGVDKTIDVPGRIISDRTMLPLRFLSETMGYTVSYDKYTQGIGVIDSKNSQALTLTINSKEVGIHSGLTSKEQLCYSQEYIDAKNVVVDNLNYALKDLINDGRFSNPFGLSATEIETYKQTGSCEGLNTFQVLNYVNANGNEVPGFVMVTGTYGFKNHISDMEYAVDWLNKVDPTMLRSFVGTTKYIATDIADSFYKTYFEQHPSYAGTYNSKDKYILINEGKAFEYKLPYAFFTSVLLVESKAIQLALEGKTVKEQGMGKAQFLLDWANQEYAAGKITQQEYGIIDCLAKGNLDYYSKLS